MRRLHAGFARLLLTGLLLVHLGGADAARGQPAPEARAAAHARTLSPYFVVDTDDPETDRMPLLGTEVQVDVSGVIADITVKQTYRNDGTRPLHAKYVFPASTRAAVHGLTMIVGEQRIRAQIREREQAKAEFQAAKRAGKNAALLEQQRPNVFTMNVSNVMPGQTIEVELRYTELLVPEAGVYEWVYPTVVGPRYSTVKEDGAADRDLWLRSPYTPEGRSPTYALRLSGTLGAGMPIDGLACYSHDILTQWVDPTRVHVTLDPNAQDGGNRDFVLRYRLDGGRIQTGLLLYEAEDENFFLLMMQPPRRVEQAQIPPREYLFVVDVSGSMNGFPLNTAKDVMRDLVGRLRPTDTFNMLFFSGDSRLWSPRSRPATEGNVADAVRMLDGQKGGGGTELFAAIRRAMDLPGTDGVSRNLIVVTDGYIGAEREVFEHIGAHLGEAGVFAFGIGSSVNRHLIEGIARAGRGEAFVVLGPDEASEQARRFRAYVERPVLTDVRVAFEGFDAYDVEPASLPDLFAERPIVVHGKWRGKPAGRVVVGGVSGDGPFRAALEVSDAEPAEANRALRHLWARSRIAAISDFAMFGESDEHRRRLVELGLRYSLLTAHTSFVAVHDVVVNPGGAGDHVDQRLPLPAGVSNLAVGGMGMGDEPPLALLAAVVALGGALLAWRRRHRGHAS
jgi:Ca-activated chloride channel family protein